MSAVVDAHVLQPGQCPELQPARSEVGHRPVALPVREDEHAVARQAREHGPRGCRELGPGSSAIQVGWSARCGLAVRIGAYMTAAFL